MAVSYDRFIDGAMRMIAGGRYVGATLADFAGRFEPTAESVFICGPNGTGKTHLSVCLLREAMRSRFAEGRYGSEGCYDGMSALEDHRFYPARDLGRMVRTKWGDEGYAIDALCEPELLVLDDASMAVSTDFSAGAMFDVIDRRYANIKQTIITSNWSLTRWATVSAPIASRFSSYTQIELLGNDRRKV